MMRARWCGACCSLTPRRLVRTLCRRCSEADGEAFPADDIRAIARQVVVAVGWDPELYGAHSLRIGGATALFAGGADPMVIRTMGRWSSDCYRLYVRACLEQTVAWTSRMGSQRVRDIQGTYVGWAQEVEAY